MSLSSTTRIVAILDHPWLQNDSESAPWAGAGLLAAVIWPPWASMMRWTMARPRPVPVCLVVKKGSKIRSRFWGGCRGRCRRRGFRCPRRCAVEGGADFDAAGMGVAAADLAFGVRRLADGLGGVEHEVQQDAFEQAAVDMDGFALDRAVDADFDILFQERSAPRVPGRRARFRSSPPGGGRAAGRG